MSFNRVVKLGVSGVLVAGLVIAGCSLGKKEVATVNEPALNGATVTAGVNAEIMESLDIPEVSTEDNDAGGLMKASFEDDSDEVGEPAFAGATLYTNNKATIYKDDKDTPFCEVPAGTRINTEGYESNMFAFTIGEDIYWVRGEDLVDDYDYEKVLFIENNEGVWSFFYDVTGEKYEEPKAVKETKKKEVKSKQTVVQTAETVQETPVSESAETTDNSSSTGSSLGTYKLTAYCNCSKCCGKWAGGPTKSGAMPVAGTTVACNTLAMGTKISINGHEYVVQDTGHLADNQIDVFFDSHSAALQFGVQRAEVFLCE